MCGHASHHGHGCCCEPVHCCAGEAARRRFPTREERLAQLEAYLKDLQDEAKAVEEHLAEMKAIG